MSIESLMLSDHLILCYPLFLLPSTFHNIRVFSNESALPIRWPKYWSFSFSISPSSEYSWLISSRIDWFDLLSVKGTLKSLLQHHSWKASILWCSAFLMVQLLHLYMTTGILTFASKVMSLLFNTPSRFVIGEGNATPLQYSCLGNSHGRRSLVGYSPWGCEESDTTERLHIHFSLSCIGEGNGNPLQCSCLENPRDRGAWWAAVFGVAQSRTQLKQLSSSSRMSL